MKTFLLLLSFLGLVQAVGQQGPTTYTGTQDFTGATLLFPGYSIKCDSPDASLTIDGKFTLSGKRVVNLKATTDVDLTLATSGTVLTDQSGMPWSQISNTPSTLTGYGITSIDSVPIGTNSPSSGTFTSLNGSVPGSLGLYLLSLVAVNDAQSVVGTPFWTVQNMSGSFNASGSGTFYAVTTGNQRATVNLGPVSPGYLYIISKVDSAKGTLVTNPATRTLTVKGDMLWVWANPAKPGWSYSFVGSSVGVLNEMSSVLEHHTLATRKGVFPWTSRAVEAVMLNDYELAKDILLQLTYTGENDPTTLTLEQFYLLKGELLRCIPEP